MTVVALANFVELYKPDGSVQLRLQNWSVGETRDLNGQTFDFASYLYQGAAKNRSGDNLEAALVMSTNPISMNRAKEAVRGRYNVRVHSVLMTPDGSAVQKELTVENWLVASMTYDLTQVEVILSSAIDAVGANAPTRVLTREQVGHLPTTANIQGS
jgi:hypothetical protein